MPDGIPSEKDSRTFPRVREFFFGDPIIDRLLGIISEKDELIRQQAEDIGQLREQIEQLKMRLQKNASDAGTSGIANAG